MRETRYFNIESELRELPDTGNSRKIRGYALKFNCLSEDLGGFRECILPGALDGLIEKSDVLALYDHDRSRGILARSTNGTGSLKLIVDETGLIYEFDAPDTALGDEVVTGIKRQDLRNSSFAFTVAEEHFERQNDGTYIRYIDRFEAIYDVSIVAHPAYKDTEVDVRGLDAFKATQSLYEEDKTEIREESKMIPDEEKELFLKFQQLIREQEEKRSAEEAEKKEETEENSCSEEKEEERSDEDSEKEHNDSDNSEKKSDEETEEEKENTESEEKEEKEEERSVEENTEENSETEKRNIENFNILKYNMKEKFSLLRSIDDMINGRQMSDATARIHEAGLAELRKSNLSARTGSIVLPIAPEVEQRNTLMATVTNQGAETVASDWMNIYGPLRQRLVFDSLGVTMLTGLVGNLILPEYSGSTASWKSEGATADDNAGTFPTPKELSPKRLTAKITVSKQLLIQDSVECEQLLMADLVNAIADAWERQVFSADAGLVNVKPAGLFNGVSADSAALTFEDLVTLEQTLKHDGAYGNYKYLLSTSAEAITRTTRKDAGSGLFCQEGNSINGIPVISSGLIEEKGLALGLWNEMICGIWSGITVTPNPYSKLDQDLIDIVATTYVDTIVRRDNAIVKKILA